MKDVFEVAASVKDGHHLQRTGFRPVNDEVRICGEKPDVCFGEIFANVASARMLGEKHKLLLNGRFDPISCGLACVFLEISPDVDQVTRGLW